MLEFREPRVSVADVGLIVLADGAKLVHHSWHIQRPVHDEIPSLRRVGDKIAAASLE